MKEMTMRHIHCLDGEYLMDCSMVSSYPELFGNCESNYEVESILRKGGVITEKMETDTETCALVIGFKSKRSAECFVERFNKWQEKFLQEKEKARSKFAF